MSDDWPFLSCFSLSPSQGRLFQWPKMRGLNRPPPPYAFIPAIIDRSLVGLTLVWAGYFVGQKGRVESTCVLLLRELWIYI